ncbi:polysaccharide lyase [Sphingobacterium sp. DN00404]|uniref:Polysaccharide lyase n=1 Tax=Sphingobacterium micropteri TaxID=2763501 RepID=A0ABR7YPG9_9SPHI|nr:polysaccharide lyase [Sphingobacterium micropteri]MBD1433210.1 polysaccharide lyase [Sphingobacterium micropteri]
MNKIFSLLVVIIAVATIQEARAQYPKIPAEVKAETDELMRKAQEQSDLAWKKAWPTIVQYAKQGKPYIPWASRLTDLPQAEIPAFPGAEGGGKYSFGGRGGKVIVVTSLEDNGPGTLREACEQGGPRIIVFNVAGIIRLKTPLMIRAPYVTIAGQSAPGDGVCVAGESVWIDTHDVVIRHMRFRRGETYVGRRDDAIGGNPVGNIMIDHVSASWGLDENMSIYRHMYSPGGDYPEVKLGTVNVTIQNSIFSEALDTYNHSLGSTLGGENCSFMRNLWANNAGRNPSIGWNGIFNFVNNVVFNWSHRTTDGGDYTAQYNIINNYYKPGPVTPVGKDISHRILRPDAVLSRLDTLMYGRAHVAGNIIDGNAAVTADNWNGGVQLNGKEGSLSKEEAQHYLALIKYDKPFPMPEMTILSSDNTFDHVMDNAGATLPKRDPVDERIIRTVKTGKPEYAEGLDPESFYQFKHRRLPADSYKQGIITDVAQVGGYPEYKGKPYRDTDNDGIPDDVEVKMGLDPKNPNDAAEITESGYANIELYLNELASKG